jgi:hypothetical protein
MKRRPTEGDALEHLALGSNGRSRRNSYGCVRFSNRPLRARYPGIRGSRAYLIRKASLVSFVPFISSRIQTGVIPRPDHFRFLSFLL